MRVELELLTCEEAGEVLGVGGSRVRQMYARGQLPAALTLPGPRHLFYRADVERLRADRMVARATLAGGRWPREPSPRARRRARPGGRSDRVADGRAIAGSPGPPDQPRHRPCAKGRQGSGRRVAPAADDASPPAWVERARRNAAAGREAAARHREIEYVVDTETGRPVAWRYADERRAWGTALPVVGDRAAVPDHAPGPPWPGPPAPAPCSAPGALPARPQPGEQPGAAGRP